MIRDAAIVATAATLLCVGTRVPGACPDSERTLSLFLCRRPAEGARRAGHEQRPAPKTHPGIGSAMNTWRRGPKQETVPRGQGETPVWLPPRPPVARQCPPRWGEFWGSVRWPRPQFRQVPPPQPSPPVLFLHLPLDRSWWCHDSPQQGARSAGSSIPRSGGGCGCHLRWGTVHSERGRVFSVVQVWTLFLVTARTARWVVAEPPFWSSFLAGGMPMQKREVPTGGPLSSPFLSLPWVKGRMLAPMPSLPPQPLEYAIQAPQ